MNTRNRRRRRLRRKAHQLLKELVSYAHGTSTAILRDVLEVDQRELRQVVKEANRQLADDGKQIILKQTDAGPLYKITARGLAGIDWLAQGKLNLQRSSAAEKGASDD